MFYLNLGSEQNMVVMPAVHQWPREIMSHHDYTGTSKYAFVTKSSTTKILRGATQITLPGAVAVNGRYIFMTDNFLIFTID